MNPINNADDTTNDKKWIGKRQAWGQIHSQLEIYFDSILILLYIILLIITKFSAAFLNNASNLFIISLFLL